MNQYVKGWCLAVYCLFCGIVINGVNAADTEVNVALAKWGTTATANSIYSGAYSAGKAIDGKWQNQATDKWNSSQGREYWIALDFGTEREIDKVVIHHEGGPYITSDFKIQKEQTKDGPWVDLVSPIESNANQVSEHGFGLTNVQFLRLYITKGEQNGSDYARIYEIEALSPVEKVGVLFGLEPVIPFQYELIGSEQKKVYSLELYSFTGVTSFDNVDILVNGNKIKNWKNYSSGESKEILLGFEDSTLIQANLKKGDDEFVCEREIVVAAPYFMGGMIHLIQASHQDIAWIDAPAACQQYRYEFNIIPALEFMHKIPGFCYSVEQTMYLMDFVRV